MTIERKTFVLQKAAIDESGTLSGYGAIFGNVDDGGDIIEPGFFSDVLADFKREGFISWGHDWSNPCAMPTLADEDKVGLSIGATFHSDAQSQRYRTIAAERLAAGLTMGLSIGYEVAKAKDGPDGRHLIKASRLFEVGLVLVPMNREAGVSDVKTISQDPTKTVEDNLADANAVLDTIMRLIEAESADLEPVDAELDAEPVEDPDLTTLQTIRDLITDYIAVLTPDAEAEPAAAGRVGLAGLVPFATHADRVEADFKSLTARAHVISRRRKEGRVLSSANVERLRGLIETLAAGVDDLKDLLASSEKGHDMALEFELAMARSYGALPPS